jgi:hypothetical protein
VCAFLATLTKLDEAQVNLIRNLTWELMRLLSFLAKIQLFWVSGLFLVCFHRKFPNSLTNSHMRIDETRLGLCVCSRWSERLLSLAFLEYNIWFWTQWLSQRGRGRYSFWIHTLSPPPDFELSDWPKGVGGGILSGFTHYPHHLILNSVIDPKG